MSRRVEQLFKAMRAFRLNAGADTLNFELLNINRLGLTLSHRRDHALRPETEDRRFI